MAELKFVESHNIAGCLVDPPAAHSEFKSMIVGLNNCRISHALRVNPVIRKDLITEFWRNAAFQNAGAGSSDRIESMVKGKKIVVTEQTIREVLQFGDKPEFPTELPVEKISGVLKKMNYEGVFPPTAKKQLPPYWRFLAHSFVSCISGRKGGTDEISLSATSAIVALTMDWEFNFSKFVFDEMRSNLTGKKKDLFLMYPRFLQMIFDEVHPELEGTPDTLDVKSLGPNTFGLMKQTRKTSKVVFKGTEKLVKFGKFAETEGVQSAGGPSAIIAEEHVVPPKKILYSSMEISDEEDVLGDLQSEEQVHKEPTEEEVEALLEKIQSTARKPPQTVTATSVPPPEEDQPEEDPSPLQRKRKRRDPRPGVLIPEVTQPTNPIVERTQAEPAASSQASQEPATQAGSSHASGSSSAQGATPQDPFYDASVRLAEFLAAQDSI